MEAKTPAGKDISVMSTGSRGSRRRGSRGSQAAPWGKAPNPRRESMEFPDEVSQYADAKELKEIKEIKEIKELKKAQPADKQKKLEEKKRRASKDQGLGKETKEKSTKEKSTDKDKSTNKDKNSKKKDGSLKAKSLRKDSTTEAKTKEKSVKPVPSKEVVKDASTTSAVSASVASTSPGSAVAALDAKIAKTSHMSDIGEADLPAAGRRSSILSISKDKKEKKKNIFQRKRDRKKKQDKKSPSGKTASSGASSGSASKTPGKRQSKSTLPNADSLANVADGKKKKGRGLSLFRRKSSQADKASEGSLEREELLNQVGKGPLIVGGALPKDVKKIREPVSAMGFPLEQQAYYHSYLPRDEILVLLQKDGDFIVRESLKNDETWLVLSVMWKAPRHFSIRTDDEGNFRLEGPSFKSIPDLVDYYVMTGEQVTAATAAVLLTPINREKWELRSNDVQMLDRLGSGNFGDVFKGKLTDKDTGKSSFVAIKTCKQTMEETEKKKFLGEARIMRRYDHDNIVRLFGVVAERDKMWIVMEFITGGALDSYLKKNRGKVPLVDKSTFTLHAAKGMAYLEEQKCIHRDLAARNCLLGEQKVVKIADFGLSREGTEFTLEANTQIPIKWTAPEALQTGHFTSKSDVWSFGILMWEIYAEALNPYPGLTNKDVLTNVAGGKYRMEPPQEMPQNFARIMELCWSADPAKRPTFEQLRNDIDRVRQNIHGARLNAGGK